MVKLYVIIHETSASTSGGGNEMMIKKILGIYKSKENAKKHITVSWSPYKCIEVETDLISEVIDAET